MTKFEEARFRAEVLGQIWRDSEFNYSWIKTRIDDLGDAEESKEEVERLKYKLSVYEDARKALEGLLIPYILFQ